MGWKDRSLLKLDREKGVVNLLFSPNVVLPKCTGIEGWLRLEHPSTRLNFVFRLSGEKKCTGNLEPFVPKSRSWAQRCTGLMEE